MEKLEHELVLERESNRMRPTAEQLAELKAQIASLEDEVGASKRHGLTPRPDWPRLRPDPFPGEASASTRAIAEAMATALERAKNEAVTARDLDSSPSLRAVSGSLTTQRRCCTAYGVIWLAVRCAGEGREGGDGGAARAAAGAGQGVAATAAGANKHADAVVPRRRRRIAMMTQAGRGDASGRRRRGGGATAAAGGFAFFGNNDVDATSSNDAGDVEGLRRWLLICRLLLVASTSSSSAVVNKRLATE